MSGRLSGLLAVLAISIVADGQGRAADGACTAQIAAFGEETYGLASAIDQMVESGMMEDGEHEHWLGWLSQRNRDGRVALESASHKECIEVARTRSESLTPLRSFIETRRAETAGAIGPIR